MNRGDLWHKISSVGSRPSLFYQADLDFFQKECTGDLAEILNSTIFQCIRYAESVVEFLEIQIKCEGNVTEEYREIDSRRHVIHTATEDSIKVLARNMTSHGKDGSWIKNLPQRAACGKFAIQIAYQFLQKKEVSRGH